MKTKYTLATLSVALLATAANSFAAEGQEDPWRFAVTLPMQAVRLDGDITVGGNKQDVNVSFDKIKDHLETAFSLGFEARKQKFGFYTGLAFMEFEPVGTGPLGSTARGDLKIFIADAGMAYQLVRTTEGYPFVLEATAGFRYWRTETDLTLTAPAGAVLFSGGKTRDLVDPQIGLRGAKYLSPKLHLDFAADVGGFGISDSQSDLDWTAAGLVSYDFTKWFTLSAGYKALGLQKETGSGASKNGENLVMHGAMIALKFKF